jgi:hypothetical protein
MKQNGVVAMKTIFAVAATAALFLLGFTFTAIAGSYGGPGFSGTVWFGENGGKAKQMGSVHVGSAGFLMNIEGEGQRVSSLIRWDSEIIWSLIHDQNMYMELPPEQSGWQEYEAKACVGYRNGEMQGSETVGGRATEKWRCTGQTTVPAGGTPSDATVWYDPELQFGVKSVEDNGNIFEIRDIERGAQAASLFEVPDDYQKLDMSAMMQQLMQQQQ